MDRHTSPPWRLAACACAAAAVATLTFSLFLSDAPRRRRSSRRSSSRGGSGVVGRGGRVPPFGDVYPGLVNIGNTCFLNSLLQSLAALPPFVAYLEAGVPEDILPAAHLTSSQPDGRSSGGRSGSGRIGSTRRKSRRRRSRRPGGGDGRAGRAPRAGDYEGPSLTAALAECLRELTTPSDSQRSVSPRSIDGALKQYGGFRGYDQQDAQELLQSLSCYLEAEVRRSEKLPSIARLAHGTHGALLGSGSEAVWLGRGTSSSGLGSGVRDGGAGGRERSTLFKDTLYAMAGGDALARAEAVVGKSVRAAPADPGHGGVIAPPQAFAQPFTGLLASFHQCTQCSRRTPMRNSAFIDLSLSIDGGEGGSSGMPTGALLSQRAVRLVDCLAAFVQEEELDEVECPGCTVHEERRYVAEEMRRHKARLDTHKAEAAAAAAEAAGAAAGAVPNKLSAGSMAIRKGAVLVGAEAYTSTPSPLPAAVATKKMRNDILSPRVREEEASVGAASLAALSQRLSDLDVAAATVRTMEDLSDNLAAVPTQDGGKEAGGTGAVRANEEITTAAMRWHTRTMKRAKVRRWHSISRPPPVLCLHMKRLGFDARSGYPFKSRRFVDFPLLLDLAPFCAVTGLSPVSVAYAGGDVGTAPSVGERRDDAGGLRAVPHSPRMLYELMAVVVHHGGGGSGHYTAFRRVPSAGAQGQQKQHGRPGQGQHGQGQHGQGSGQVADRGEWIFTSDEVVQRVPVETVLRCEAYMLFYNRI